MRVDVLPHVNGLEPRGPVQPGVVWLEGMHDGGHHPSHEEGNGVGHHWQEAVKEDEDYTSDCQDAEEEEQGKVLVVHLVALARGLERLRGVVRGARAAYALVGGLERVSQEVGADGLGDLVPLGLCEVRLPMPRRARLRVHSSDGLGGSWVGRAVHDDGVGRGVVLGNARPVLGGGNAPLQERCRLRWCPLQASDRGCGKRSPGPGRKACHEKCRAGAPREWPQPCREGCQKCHHDSLRGGHGGASELQRSSRQLCRIRTSV
mmetsp:Transcript_136420/g.423881  ORF Transcript_136420/g.423881 Transcript_136420/m.423881 type:complete len:262 (+) Transcript_136420:2161-2946(+)